jgi:hypothetical protein
LNLNANFAVKLPSGSAGEILISVSLVIKDSVLEITSQGKLKISYQDVKALKNVQSEEIILPMGTNMRWDAVFVEMLKKTKKISDFI